MKVILLQDGESVGELDLSQGKYTIGKGADCTIVVDDPSLAEAHARILQAEGHACIEPIEGDTIVNGKQIDRLTELIDKDVLELGSLALGLSIPADQPTDPRQERLTLSKAGNSSGRSSKNAPTVNPKRRLLIPVLALLNFMMPGSIQVLFGQYVKGVIILFLYVAMATGATENPSPILSGLILAFIVATVVDAYMLGSSLRRGQAVKKWQCFPSSRNSVPQSELESEHPTTDQASDQHSSKASLNELASQAASAPKRSPPATPPPLAAVEPEDQPGGMAGRECPTCANAISVPTHAVVDVVPHTVAKENNQNGQRHASAKAMPRTCRPRLYASCLVVLACGVGFVLYLTWAPFPIVAAVALLGAQLSLFCRARKWRMERGAAVSKLTDIAVLFTIITGVLAVLSVREPALQAMFVTLALTSGLLCLVCASGYRKVSSFAFVFAFIAFMFGLAFKGSEGISGTSVSVVPQGSPPPPLQPSTLVNSPSTPPPVDVAAVDFPAEPARHEPSPATQYSAATPPSTEKWRKAEAIAVQVLSIAVQAWQASRQQNVAPSATPGWRIIGEPQYRSTRNFSYGPSGGGQPSAARGGREVSKGQPSRNGGSFTRYQGGVRFTDMNGNSGASIMPNGLGWQATDANGNPAGRIDTHAGGYQVTDRNGNPSGFIRETPGGMQYTDANGNPAGRIDTHAGGYQVTDRNGNPSGFIRETPGGMQYTDANGNPAGSSFKFGSATFEVDANGNPSGSLWEQ